MAAVAATLVVGPLVKIVMEKVSNYLLDKYKVLKGMEKQHEILKRKLPAILDVINDAEQAATQREGAAAWLEAIKKVAYQANEVFDEFKYEALRRKAKKEGHYKELGFDVVRLFPIHNRFVFRQRMGRKLNKIVHAIEVLVTEMNAFGFKHEQQPQTSNQWRQMDQVIFDPKEITNRSRANDNKKIVEILVYEANNPALTVVPIVGMGGLGKTTLAQLVYNDPKIQEHFDLLLWVCVSDSFHVNSLAKSIVEAAPQMNGTEAHASKQKNMPLDILQNVLSGKRYLLVLDDVWTREDHKWKQLKARLEHGGMGSVVLVTTRDKGVAEIMSKSYHNLAALEDGFIKEIIETRAFSYCETEDERPAVLVNMVGEVVKRCVGSPLAATALGSLLRTKRSEEEWKAVLRRSIICTEESGILPILKLSYNDLPSHMKPCFAFCAIFPKDYEIDVDKLIQLWIAHGFIQEKHARLETIGKQIFYELASRSFFHDVNQVQPTVTEIENTARWFYCRTTCKIHDLMHDVALSVMEKECALLTEEPGRVGCVVEIEEPDQSEWLPNNARHLFLSCKEPGKKLNSSLKKSSPAIQTLLCDSNMSSSLQHRSKYSSLQALQICSRIPSFPLKPKHLHHLRYLDLSRSHIKELPESLSILYNLQTLNLSGCKFLCGLPSQMKYMTSLRYLYTHGCNELKSMPRDLRKLTSLETLTCFVAGTGPGCSKVGELGNLNLGGQLELIHLEIVTAQEAEAANLMNKRELKELSLRWTVGWDDLFRESGNEGDAGVLEKLKPHDGLHTFRMNSYGASAFPTWMGMLQNIVEIHLFRCAKVEWFISSGCGTSCFPFPNLKELTLEDLVCLKRWSEINSEGQQAVKMFPLLEKLFIIRCENLTSMPGHPTFPSLLNARIEGCPNLKTRANSPVLSVLDVEGREDQLILWVARHMNSLTNLELRSPENSTKTTSAVANNCLRQVVHHIIKRNDHDFPLAVLVLRNFKSDITMLCAYFVKLQDLSIWSSHALIHWPERLFKLLVSLKRLQIVNCKNLTGYSQVSAKPSTPSELLPHLESLEIFRCQRLVELFSVPASLRTMEIRKCSRLQSTYGRRLLASSGAGSKNLQILKLERCDVLKGVLDLPQSLKVLEIKECPMLTSLECRSGVLSSLQRLELIECYGLSSLPDAPEAYSSLQYLSIRHIRLKKLPTSLERSSIMLKFVENPSMYNTRIQIRLC